MMKDILMKLRGLTRLTVLETERVLVLEKGRFKDILTAGEHWLPSKNITTEAHNLMRPEFESVYDKALMRERPDLVAAHMSVVETGMQEVAVVERDGRVQGILKPDARMLFWVDAGPWIVTRVDITDALEIEKSLATRLIRAGTTDKVGSFEVPEGSVGLLSVDGVFARILDAGTHRFWAVGRKVAVKLVEKRWVSLDVTGQEILTKDRVSLRVNLAADYRVVDPVKATIEVKDFAESLHRALQFAFRKTLGALTLDTLLADKVSVDTKAAARVRKEMAAIGIEVGEIALKDVILPGEMKDILNQVVAVQKEAEANVIRRREETNATRSLLNTAKLMAENPVMLRLKELEALENIASKVDTLTVHNGTEGLMSDLVKLRD